MRPQLALLLATALAVGCSNRAAPAPDGGDAGGPSSAELVACDHDYAALFGRCGGPVLPAAETARQLTRFERACTNQMALPGSGVSATTLEACAAALQVSPCQFPAGPPQACRFHGSLPGGAACADGVQCASGDCAGTGGYFAPYACGACSAPPCPAGQLCLDAGGAACDCVAVSAGDVGASCDDVATVCQPGLYCSGPAGANDACQPLADGGAPCSELGNAGGCAAPDVCGPELTCVSGTDGGPCQFDGQCAPGFGCLAIGPCAPIRWVAAGQPCGDSARCLVGTCNFDGIGPPNRLPDGGFPVGTCPTVLSDGESCAYSALTTCDAFSECFEGLCTPVDAVTCP